MSVVGSWLNGELLSAYDVLHEYHDPAEGKESMKDQKNLQKPYGDYENLSVSQSL